jgi:hypothetical protein
VTIGGIVADLQTVHEANDAIGAEMLGENSSGMEGICRVLGVGYQELREDGLTRVLPLIRAFNSGEPLSLHEAGVLAHTAYLDGFLTGARWGRERL